MEVFPMVHLMSPYQLLQTVITRDFPHSVKIVRDFSLNIEVNLMLHMMFSQPL